MIELPPPEFEAARPLFQELAERHLFATAVLNHDLPGRIYVDSQKQPRSGFMSTKELQFLAGDPDNMTFNTALKQLLRETICMGDAPEVTLAEIDLNFLGNSWLHQLPFLFGDWRWPPIPNRARHYRLAKLNANWQEWIPKGYTILPLAPNGFIHEPADGRAFNVKKAEDFGTGDFGFGAMHNGRVVCLCSTDVISGQACEIGIETHPDHRRRGLAKATAAATVAHALSLGITDIWWICDVANTGSVATAVAVGFAPQFECSSYFFILDEAEHKRQVHI